MKKFTSVNDVQNIDSLIDKGLYYKANPFGDKALGQNKRIGCIFMNPSMRTRISTQVAAQNLGMEIVVLNAGSESWTLEFEDGVVMDGTSVEHIKDAARVFGQFFDILAVRSFPKFKDRNEDYSEHIINAIVEYSGIPVISMESATLHPLQSLADLITMTEVFTEKRKPKVVLSWAPHIKSIPHCVGNSFAQWINAWDKADFVITHPKGYDLDERYTSGADIEYNQDKALEDADFVYVKNWSSYQDYGKVLNRDPKWMLTNHSLRNAQNAKVMHCLPVRRNVVLSEEILDGKHSIITQQASNRVWSAQAVISEILNTNG